MTCAYLSEGIILQSRADSHKDEKACKNCKKDNGYFKLCKSLEGHRKGLCGNYLISGEGYNKDSRIKKMRWRAVELSLLLKYPHISGLMILDSLKPSFSCSQMLAIDKNGILLRIAQEIGRNKQWSYVDRRRRALRVVIQRKIRRACHEHRQIKF